MHRQTFVPNNHLELKEDIRANAATATVEALVALLHVVDVVANRADLILREHALQELCAEWELHTPRTLEAHVVTALPAAEERHVGFAEVATVVCMSFWLKDVAVGALDGLLIEVHGVLVFGFAPLGQKARVLARFLAVVSVLGLTAGS